MRTYINFDVHVFPKSESRAESPDAEPGDKGFHEARNPAEFEFYYDGVKKSTLYKIAANKEFQTKIKYLVDEFVRHQNDKD